MQQEFWRRLKEELLPVYCTEVERRCTLETTDRQLFVGSTNLHLETMSTKHLLILIVCLWASLFSSSHGEPFRIAVAGDGRADYPWNAHRACDDDGINEMVTRAIARDVLDKNASILLWTGDIANVNDANTDTLKDGLKKWRDIMADLYSHKVKVWPVRGNHEVYRYVCSDNYDGEPIPNSSGVWREVFSGPYALPSKAPKGEEDLSFYSIQGPALIIGLDEYGQADQDPVRRKHVVNQKWLDQVLAQNKKPFTFVYGHEAAFMAGGRHLNDDTLAADSVARNIFWQSLIKARATYFCGHDHLYDRMGVVRKGPNPGRETFQITAGTAGAPAYDPVPYTGATLWTLRPAKNIPKVWGYILIEVDSDKTVATITFMGTPIKDCSGASELTFEPMDKTVCDRSGCKDAPP